MFNYFKTAILMAGITGLFGLLGAFLGGHQGMLLALLFAGAANFFSYWFSDKMVLSMYGAQQVSATSAPQLYEIVKDLASIAKLPMPKVYIIESEAPNAFATGRNPEHAAVAFTTGILNILTKQQLRGVVAHELAHVEHRDILISTISATMAGAISALANFAIFFGGRDNDGRPVNPIANILLAILTPLAAMLIQMAISRTREYQADRRGAEISGDPASLAQALERLEHYSHRTSFIKAEENPSTGQMMIVNPIANGFAQLFSTHPVTTKRIARLLNMERTRQYCK